MVGLIDAVAAGIAWFHSAKGFAEFGSAGSVTITILYWFGALVVGGTAWARVCGWAEVNEMTDTASQRLI